MGSIQSITFLVLAWLLYYALHSLLASMKVKQWVRNHMSGLYPSYRLIYNAIAVLGLGGLTFLHTLLPGQSLFDDGRGSLILGAVLILSGGVVGLKALGQYDLSAFAGTSPLPDQPDQAEEPFVSAGLNAYMRHPLYTATLLFLTGVLLLKPTTGVLVAWSMGLLYIRIGIFFEEKKLLAVYGQPYADYRERVPMLFPWKGSKAGE